MLGWKVAGMLSSLETQGICSQGTALALASPSPRWDRGPCDRELGKRGLEKGVKVQARSPPLGLILPVMVFHRRELSATGNGGDLHRLCAGGCEAMENQAPFV